MDLHLVLENKEPSDLRVSKQWTVAVIAEAFHQLPSVVAKDLDEDPERLSAVCVQLLRYRDAKAAYDRASRNSEGGDDELKAWKGSKMMDAVLDNVFQLEKRKRGKK